MSEELKSKRQANREYWLGLVAEWKSGNETLIEFCKQQEINMHTFHYWRNKLNTENKSQSKNTFSQARTPTISAQPNNIRLILSNGTHVLIPANFEKNGLKEFLELLGVVQC